MTEFNIGDEVVAYGRIIGWITYVYPDDSCADIEFDEGNFDYTSMCVPFKHLKKVEKNG